MYKSLFISLSIITLTFLFSGAAQAITSAQCEARVNDTTTKLVECIQKDALWNHMVQFQNISDSNPDHTFDGFPGAPHGSRDPGTPGDIASVNYIVNKMTAAGYNVTVQSYPVPYSADVILPVMEVTSPVAHTYTASIDFQTMQGSGIGEVTAQLQAVGPIIIPPTPITSSTSGCTAADFSGFVPGRIALMQRGACDFSVKAANARNAGAVAVLIFNEGNPGRTSLIGAIAGAGNTFPILDLPFAVGADLYAQLQNGPVTMHVKSQSMSETRTTYNVIAESKGGDPNSVLVIDAHYDSIFGAGMLDNASGSVTILEIALKMQKVKPANKLRFIWFGGEELGLYGSKYYINSLSSAELNKIAYVMDADVTATPNYRIGLQDPSRNNDAASIPNRVFKASLISLGQMADYLKSIGLNYSPGTSNGTDSHSFHIAGIPGGGIFTGQECCKTQAFVDLFGGVVGNYEGNIGSFDGGCVDTPFKFCDNLSNNDPNVLEFISRTFAYSVVQLTFDNKLKSASNNAVIKPNFDISNDVGRHFKLN